jgi:threonine dehydrogenase-like Zn-dependent dehydrogenase
MMNKGLTIKTGQCHVHRYVPELLEHIRSGRIDPSFVVTQRVGLSQAAEAYKLFRFHQDESVKIVLDPAA